jgi:hypothetical protein
MMNTRLSSIVLTRGLRKHSIVVLLALIASSLIAGDHGTASDSSKKHLIELGWDAPTPNHFRANIKAMERQPFDGLMVNLNAGKTIFNKIAYPESAFKQDQIDLAATTSRKLEHNFITIWSARENGWDWFNDNDWKATETNAHNFAKTAKAGRFNGFFFDPEPYGTNPWSYNATLYPKQDFASVQAKVRARGAAFLNAIQTEMPEVKIMTLFGMTIVKAQAAANGSLEKADWALLGAFIDGMLDVINPKAELIDGNEGSYYYTAAQGFRDFRAYKDSAREFVSLENRSKYDNQVKVAHAVFADGLLNLWKSPRFFGYYLQTDRERQQFLEHNTYQALQSSDEYIWFYNENMDWWGSKGKGVQLPKGLEAVLKRATQKIDKNQALGLKVEDFVARASLRFNAKVQVAGRITHNGKGLGEVYLDSGHRIYDTDSACFYSNPDGYFACTLPPNWTGKIIPALKGFRFEAPEVTLNNLSKNIDDQQFTAIPQ